MKTDTANRLVRDWLSKLDRELTKLPRGRAQELRADLTAHLDEMVPPNTPDDEVNDVLAQFGDPAELVTEALGDSKPRGRLKRVRVRTWILLGTAAALIISGATVSLVVAFRYAHAPNLYLCCDSQLITHAKFTEVYVGNKQFTVVADSPGHRLGLYADIQNHTSVTQTILGVPADFGMWHQGLPHTLRFAVSTQAPSLYDESRRYSRQRFTTDPVSVGPGQTRTLRITDLTTCGGNGSEETVSSIPLRVRVGWFTRTENFELDAPLVFKSTEKCHFSK